MSPRLVDVFAGAGGETTGAHAAGWRVVAALNHSPRALATHQANYPHTTHLCDNALAYDWRDLPDHDAGHLSPECTYFALRARGGKVGPARDLSRATALCTTRYARACERRVITVENVLEYADSPEATRVVRALRRLGYHHRRFRLNSVHFRVPQSRERIFEVFVKGRPVPRWTPPVLAPEAWTPTATILDPKARWNPTEPAARQARGLRLLAPRTVHQLAVGAARFAGAPFLLPYFGAWRRDSGYTVVYPITAPLGTLTTVDRYAVARQADGRWQIRMLTPSEQARAFGFPADYQLTGTRREQVRQVGNALCPPVATWLLSRVAEML